MKIKQLPPQKTRKRPNGGNRGHFNTSSVLNKMAKHVREAQDMTVFLDGFLANGYAKRIKRMEGKFRPPTFAKVIAGIVDEEQKRW